MKPSYSLSQVSCVCACVYEFVYMCVQVCVCDTKRVTLGIFFDHSSYMLKQGLSLKVKLFNLCRMCRSELHGFSCLHDPDTEDVDAHLSTLLLFYVSLICMMEIRTLVYTSTSNTFLSEFLSLNLLKLHQHIKRS